MKITALIENTTARDDCVAEFGLSFLIEANGRHVLFDAGQSGKIAENAQVLGIDLAAIDTAALSHGHYDHANGFSRFFEVNTQATLYVRRGYDGDYWAERGEYIGVAPELVGRERLAVIEDERTDLGDGFFLLSYAGREPALPIEPFGLFRKEGGKLVSDEFLHEQYLLVVEGKIRLLVTGCSHRGIRNILHWSAEERPTHVLGGFHLFKIPLDDPALLDAAADGLLAYPAHYITCHCTGLDQYRYLKERMGDRLEYIAAGQTIEL
ncbi:MAG: MBL fold metallo-hydrolase [Eggerthellaceae bacterium]|nr:MBL fold metallo-hydrolase [Eggerthellaceae bacterium]